MITYTHAPTGVTVEQREDGSLVATSGSRQFWPPAEITAAIHAAYLDSLALWLDEPTGALVCTATRRDERHVTYSVLCRDSRGEWMIDDGWAGAGTDERAAAVDRYLATITPQPTPQPGEEWVLLTDLGSVEVPVEVVQIAGELWFAWARDGHVYSELVADRHPSTYRRAES